LVDADRLDSAGRQPNSTDLCAGLRLEALLKHIGSLSGRSGNQVVSQMRTRILNDCLSASTGSDSLMSLSVPTGGGKTLAAMAFALKRAEIFPDKFRRIIVVIPYLSIIEQNARVYTEIFGTDALLEHHSGSVSKLVGLPDSLDDYYVPAPEGGSVDDKSFQESGQRLETENWDAPIVITTSVRFFESLFSNRPSDLRRVHNIARSIVILDEVQTLPRRLLGPLLSMMKELSDDWGTNFVFSTATRPAFERSVESPADKSDLRWPAGTLTEIIQKPEEIRNALKRVEITWEIDSPLDWNQVADRMMSVPQSLAIVNVRDHAYRLYETVLSAADQKGMDKCGVFHLSTCMCAAHRLRVLDVIRECLVAKLPCHVISTQLVEAGVDVDFPLVMRSLGPLDSIIQATGRADREGNLTAIMGKPGGRVIVFLPVDHKLPPNEYAEAAGITEALVRNRIERGHSVQVDSAEDMQLYFERYYGGSGTDLGLKLVEFREQERFATLSQEFEMISSRTRDVLHSRRQRGDPFPPEYDPFAGCNVTATTVSTDFRIEASDIRGITCFLGGGEFVGPDGHTSEAASSAKPLLRKGGGAASRRGS